MNDNRDENLKVFPKFKFFYLVVPFSINIGTSGRGVINGPSYNPHRFYKDVLLLCHLILFKLPSPLILRDSMRATRSARANVRRKFSPRTLRISCSE